MSAPPVRTPPTTQGGCERGVHAGLRPEGSGGGESVGTGWKAGAEVTRAHIWRRTFTLVILGTALALSACGGGKHNPGPDGTPPAAITDLTVLAADDTSITMGWTAPGDDGGG